MPNLSTQRRDPRLTALGNSIRELRASQGVSQEALALLSGVDRSYVGRVERGDNNVAVLTLCRISDALGTRPSALLRKAGL